MSSLGKSTGKDSNPYDPGYQANSAYISSRFLQPIVIFNGTIFISTSRTSQFLHGTAFSETTPASGSDLKSVPVELETTKVKMVREMKTLLREESTVTNFTGKDSWPISKSKKEYVYIHDTHQYMVAKAMYLAKLNVASCMNANLDYDTYSENKDSMGNFEKALLQWDNFPFIEVEEIIKYVPVTKTQPNQQILESVEVRITQKVFDIYFGIILSEITMTFLGKSLESESEITAAEEAGIKKDVTGRPDVYARYLLNDTLMGGEQCRFAIPSVHKDVLFSPKDIRIVQYQAVTTRIAEKKTELWENYRITAAGMGGLIIAPSIRLRSKESDTLLSGIPKIPKIDMNDFRDRYGLFGIGELPVKLTARKLKLSSGFVNTVIQSIKEYRVYSSAEQLGNKAEALRAFGQGELSSTLNSVVSEMNSALEVIIPYVSRDLDISAYKVQMVLQLYTVRYMLSDALTIKDFIPEVEKIVDKYIEYEDKFLKLLSCQRNLDYSMISLGWEEYKKSGFGSYLITSIVAWLKILKENNSLLTVDLNSALNIWNTYSSFVNKVKYFEALQAYREMMTKMASYRRISSNHINTMFDVHIGDAVRGHDVKGRVQNVSMSVSGDSVPTVSITAVSLPDSFSPIKVL